MTAARCFSSSVARNASAAVTTLAVADGAVVGAPTAARDDMNIDANMPRTQHEMNRAFIPFPIRESYRPLQIFLSEQLFGTLATVARSRPFLPSFDDYRKETVQTRWRDNAPFDAT